MANHADLPSSEWHPAYPPGSDLASSGDIFVSDGAGAGAWESFTDTLTSEKAYGQLYTSGSTINVTQATDSALDTDIDYINLTTLSMWTGSLSKDVTLDATNGTLTTTKPGTYRLSFWTDHYVDGTANVNIAFKFSVDGAFSPIKLISTSDFSGDIRNSSADGLVEVTEGQVVRLHVAATSAVALTLESGQLSIERL